MSAAPSSSADGAAGAGQAGAVRGARGRRDARQRDGDAGGVGHVQSHGVGHLSFRDALPLVVQAVGALVVRDGPARGRGS